MPLRFEELDRAPTAMGEISLRRRVEPTLGVDIYEVKLDDEFLMSSLFTVAETALGTLGLGALRVDGSELDVVVGGLGLGYTAGAVLADPRVRSLHVVEAVAEVIGWHQRGLLPLSPPLGADDRCRLVHGDFFAMVAGADELRGPWHAVLVDIDHTPGHVLHPSHAAFYTDAGLRRVADRLHPGGVFALWSDDPPDDGFVATAEGVFGSCAAHVVTFRNPYTDGESANTVYVAGGGAGTLAGSP